MLFAVSAPVRADEAAPCERIVSLAPSVTEVLFALGLGDRVVGVSRYDRYPDAVAPIEKVGGLFDPNFEVIVGLRPSLVVVLSEFGDRIAYGQKLGLNLETVDHRSIAGILGSIETLGRLCGAAPRAKELTAELQSGVARITASRPNGPPVRTMIVVGGGNEGRVLKSVFVSGRDGFYDELVRLAGGENVLKGGTTNVPTVSAEGLLALDPEVIIQVRDDVESRGASPGDIEAAWRTAPYLRAVKNGRVYVISDDFVTIPGPRFVKTLERFAAIIQPLRAAKEPR